MVAAAPMVSANPNWLGGDKAVITTEGNDFWLTYPNIDLFDAESTEGKKVPFEMKVIISSREAVDVIIAAGNDVISPSLHVNAGETQIFTIDREQYAKTLYLFSSETPNYKGVHVYAAPTSKDKHFSCFSYCRKDNAANSSRDAALILPTQLLGKEYYIQTTPEDLYSSEFAVIATADGTEVTITPADTTFQGKLPKQPFTVTLNKGDAYLVSSHTHQEGNKDYRCDLTGSTICANKPVAVFNGNQQTSVPIDPLQVRDYTVEQVLPISQWGKEFYISLLSKTKTNYFRVTAAYDSHVEVRTEKGNSSFDLTAGQSISIGDYIVGLDADEFVLKSDTPILCYSYMSSANKNIQNLNYGGKIFPDFGSGNTANAMVPAWSHRVTSMNFFTHELDPTTVREGSETPQFFYVYLVTKTSNVSHIKVDGVSKAGEFHTFAADNSMSYAHIEVGNNANHYHWVESDGEGFVGLVYAFSHAQGYYNSLGFKPINPGDSLYITNTDEVKMSKSSYDLDSIPGHGWYQRQWDEWIEGKEQLDTAVVCDSTTVRWAMETPAEKPITTIEWLLYDVTDGKRPSGSPKASTTQTPALGQTKYNWAYQFILPEEAPESRHQFFEYELQTILHRKRLMCSGEDADTLKTTVRVTRIYNDTLYRVVCVGDTLRFFYDSLYNQSDLNLHRHDSAATKFVGVKKGQGDKYLEPWKYQVEVGKYDTLSRHYLSQAGCDSSMTLVLFVCDTFQFYDTIHLCRNQDTLYHGQKYRGTSFAKDTTDLVVTFTTNYCDCQTSPFANKFRDKNGRKFNGCDSTYYLHLIIHPSYELTKVDTMCYNTDPDKKYTWPINYGTEIMYIDSATPGMNWNEKLHAWVGTFYDQLKTTDCPECRGGQGGCDSVNILKLTIPKPYYFEEDTSWCQLKYDPVKQDTVHRYFRWEGHLDEHGNVRELRTTGDYYDSCQSRFGCDSIYHIHVTYNAPQEIYLFTDTTICQNPKDTVYWIGLNNDTLGVFPLDAPTTIRRHDDSRCDTVYALRIRILPSYTFTDKAKISEEMSYLWTAGDTIFFYGTKYTGPHPSQYENRLVESGIIKDTAYMKTQPVDGYECDSIRDLVLEVGSVYRYVTEDFLCATQYSYRWTGVGKDGKDTTRMVITENDLPAPNYHQTYEQPFKTALGYDSVYVLDLFRAPAYKLDTRINVCQVDGGTFEWEDHEGRTIYNEKTGAEVSSLAIPIESAGDFYYLDYLHTDSFGCDSIWRLHLHVYPYYHKDTTMTVCQYDDFIWPNNNQDSIWNGDNRRITTVPTNHTGDYSYTVFLHSVYGCDSIYRLTLHVDTVYLQPVDTTLRTMCDNDTLHFYEYVLYGAKYKDKPAGIPGISIPGNAPYFSFDTVYTDKTREGCDSAVVHRITMYRTYEITEDSATCQTAGDRTDPYYTWTGHTRVWDVQRKRYIMGNEIPTKGVGNMTYTYIDSLKTEQCAVRDKYGECGCDSVHILRLRLDSSYYFYNPLKICDYDSITWQGKHYAGPKLTNPLPGYQVLKADTTYRDTLIRYTIHDCDSIYYLALRVAPSYDTTVTYNVCDNDSSDFAHVYIFSDRQGHYYRDSIEFNPTPTRMGVEKKDSVVEISYMLQSVEGCDSLVTYRIIIHPTYRYIETGKVCTAQLPFIWRDQVIRATGVYIIKDSTVNGCDSVFELDFYVKPFEIVPVYDFVCDNQTYYHRDTIGETVYSTVVWHPGAPIPDPDKIPYIAVHFNGMDGCDSIVYQYHLTVCKTYEYQTDTNGLCLGKPFEYSFVTGQDTVTHIWETTALEFDVDTFVLPFDTVFIDSLFTEMGCDSVFILNAHAFPSYRNVRYDTICSNETYLWPARDLRPDSIIGELAPGVYYLRDSFLTVEGCDSIYETQLCVNPNYVSVETFTLCADETLQWRDHYYEHMAPGEYFEQDNLTSYLGCDSVFQLYLTVLDTTYEINFDSICIGDTLFVGEHMYTAPGDYKDTTTNADGCRHFIYTHLAVIPPTVPSVWAEDPMCQSERAFDLYYTYTSHKPLSYSLYFDSIGLEMGFEDMIDVPITSYTDPMVISVPIPYRGDDPTQYPRPNNYTVRLVLDNGICRHKEQDCFHDSTFVMSYPKWLTEQRFGDVIALLNETLNGGYIWTQYQWYQGDTKLVGQTQPYLYIPTGLVEGAEYHVELIREGEKEAFPTCPIVAVANPIINDVAPTMGYLSVVPTCIVTGHPYFNILSRKDGTYRVTTSDGVMVKEGTFRADVTEVQIPPTAGMYIVQLWSYDTPEEPYRAIKIIVKDRCENCATSF